MRWIAVDEITSGTDWTGPRPDGPAIGSFGWPESDDIFGLVIPLAAGRPLDVDVHVDVVVALLYELLPDWAIDVELLFAPVKETPVWIFFVYLKRNSSFIHKWRNVTDNFRRILSKHVEGRKFFCLAVIKLRWNPSKHAEIRKFPLKLLEAYSITIISTNFDK